MADGKPCLSFEFFPPKTPVGHQKLLDAADHLASYRPEFFSVTYGAGGSTRDGTLNTVLALRELGHEVAPHLSFSGNDRDEVHELLQRYRQAGIRRVVALRGDAPSGMGAAQRLYARDLVAFIRAEFGTAFSLEVAAYPEVHPESKSAETELRHFAEKVAAGADGAITQYFFSPDAYFRFLDECERQGVGVPIVPGIMPITNHERLVRFSDACGAEIPRWIRKRLETFGDDTNGLIEFGAEVVTRLCEQLLAGGAPGLHFYTLNQSEPSARLCNALGFGH
ncbi:MAG: methylenetetrahydrofolate reductase [NAD(P)H] [Pseudomonadota bacterium]|nr:methylenetetrahydrofolate reductase [NAD(P)H] [Pseudomonadota bacterium]